MDDKKNLLQKFVSAFKKKDEQERGYTASARENRPEKYKRKVKERDLGDVTMTKDKVVTKGPDGVKKTVTKTYKPNEPKKEMTSQPVVPTSKSTYRSYDNKRGQVFDERNYYKVTYSDGTEAYRKYNEEEEDLTPGYSKFYHKRNKQGTVLSRERKTDKSMTSKAKIKTKPQGGNKGGTPRYS